MTYPPNKTAEELGLKVGDKFRVERTMGTLFDKGDLIELDKFSGTHEPLCKRLSDSFFQFTPLSNLSPLHETITPETLQKNNMTIYEELKYLRDRKYFALVKNEDDEVKIFSTETSDGNVRSSDWCVSEKKALDSLGCTSYSKSEIDEYSEKNNWQIVRPIHVTEILPGRGFEEGEKVKIPPNAKEECGKFGISWNSQMDQMIKDGYGYFHNYCGSDLTIYNKNKSDYWIFYPTAIAPILKEPKEITLEEALELLKKEYGEDVTITLKGESL